MAHALGIVAIDDGRARHRTNSWARENRPSTLRQGLMSRNRPERGSMVNEDILGARGGFVDVFGGGGSVARLRRPRHAWNIVDFLAIKLWPGAYLLSGTLEAAVNVARQANVPANGVAQILIAWLVPHDRRRQPAVRAIPSRRFTASPYFVASAVADKEFTWIDATGKGEIFDPVVARLMGLVEL